MKKGKLVLKEAPRVVSEREDRLLAESMNGINKDSSESEDLSDDSFECLLELGRKSDRGLNY